MAARVTTIGVVLRDAPLLVTVLEEDGRERFFSRPMAAINDPALRALIEQLAAAADAVAVEETREEASE